MLPVHILFHQREDVSLDLGMIPATGKILMNTWLQSGLCIFH